MLFWKLEIECVAVWQADAKGVACLDLGEHGGQEVRNEALLS